MNVKKRRTGERVPNDPSVKDFLLSAWQYGKTVLVFTSGARMIPALALANGFEPQSQSELDHWITGKNPAVGALWTFEVSGSVIRQFVS